MICTSWGMYPKVECRQFRVEREDALRHFLSLTNGVIPRGNGRSYGDSALSYHLIDVRPKDCFISFDKGKGLLHVQAGVLLSEIIETFVPKGWFLNVTPGTKHITVGGAIASDVHGKNHHVAGCFSEYVEEFRMMLENGEIVTCSRDTTVDLWRATCGGMGLTGIILDAKIYLKKIHSKFIDQITIKTGNLKETLDAFDEYAHMPYSVAWIDCLAKEEESGKGLLMVGAFRNDGDLNYKIKPQKVIPFTFPCFTLNKWSIKTFNHLYYRRVKEKLSKEVVELDKFFFPLDVLESWNRLYGKKGFTQYQFILPKENSYDGLQAILAAITKYGRGSFLAVLKLCGNANQNFLSFPMEGYSLALDFKIEQGLFEFLHQLDQMVVEYGGRIYLAKDVRVSREIFEKGYPEIERFRELRRSNRMDTRFQSLQSRRVGI